jgi:catechol 2,3-dioxygenase-like lactoylglutathione lyase family enzyme
MPIVKVLGALAVADMPAAREWYERLLGRPADEVPMEAAAEWNLTGSGSLQLVQDRERAGHGLLTLAVDDIAEQLEALGFAGLEIESDTLESATFRTVTIRDPDGNAITFAQDVRARG